MRKVLIGTVVIMLGGLILCGGAARAIAADAAGEAGPLKRFITGQFGRLLTLKSDLNLSADQKQQIKQIVMAHKQDIATVATPLATARRALRDATLAEPANEQAIRSAADTFGKAIGDAAVLASKIKVEAVKVMTPEQVKTIEQFRSQSDQNVDRFINELQDAK